MSCAITAAWLASCARCSLATATSLRTQSSRDGFAGAATGVLAGQAGAVVLAGWGFCATGGGVLPTPEAGLPCTAMRRPLAPMMKAPCPSCCTGTRFPPYCTVHTFVVSMVR